MKRLIIAAALAFAASSCATSEGPAPAAAAAATPAASADADPALWVVRDADTTIYLFGTFHMLDGRPWFNDEVRAAFDQSDEVVLEAVLPSEPTAIVPLIQRYAIDPRGRTLSSRLSPEQNATLDRALRTLGGSAAAFDRMEPWFVTMTLATVAGRRLGLNPEHGPETVLSRAARERNIPVSELEGLEWQFRLFDGAEEAEQMTRLRASLDDLETMHEKLRPMLAAWAAGDVEAMNRIIDQSRQEDAALHRLLFTSRNATWAGWVQERLARPGTVFVAVGVGHLAGADSVQAALRARGVPSARVPHVEDGPAG